MVTVKELIKQLEKFPPDRLVIIDLEGNTDPCPTPEWWSEGDLEGSPVAFKIKTLRKEG